MTDRKIAAPPRLYGVGGFGDLGIGIGGVEDIRRARAECRRHNI
jgi:hypothetical protein